MEYLLMSLMLWGKKQNYQWFNLGMAPLSGLENHPLAPLWHKLGNTIFRLGREFYNFEGLYQYKSKFRPSWQPRYLATTSGLKVASTLIAVTSLISTKPEQKK
jgi:phosphatidylglycerol lysyltransferase